MNVPLRIGSLELIATTMCRGTVMGVMATTIVVEEVEAVTPEEVLG